MAIHCTACGAELFSGQRFCNQCGKSSAEAQSNQPPYQGMPPSAVTPDYPQYGADPSQWNPPPAPGQPGSQYPPASGQPGPDPQYPGPLYPPASGQPGPGPQYPGSQYPPADQWASPPSYQPMPVPPAYGTPYSVPNAPRSNSTATTAFILSLVGLVCFGLILEPIAIFLAVKAKKEIAADPLQTGSGMATAALSIGIIGTLLYGAFVVFFLVGIVANGVR